MTNHRNYQFALVFLSLFFACSVAAQNLVPKSFKSLNGPYWSFHENKGQLFDENHTPLNDIPYYGRQGGVNIYCKPGMISFVFAKAENDAKVSEATGQLSELGFAGLKDKKGFPLNNRITNYTRAELQFLNANLHAEITASDQQTYYENYYTTGNADHGITNVHTYKTITYKNIYPYIDLVLEAKEHGMEYSFIVYPGGNVDDIQLQWNGLDNIKDLENGGISYQLSCVSVGAGLAPAPTFTESAPISYQQTRPKSLPARQAGSPTGRTSSFAPGSAYDSERTPLPMGERSGVGSYRTREVSRISFSVPAYDKTKTLIIDPTLDWGTYYGGGDGDIATAITHDANNNIYITGYTESSSGIATTGAYQTNYGGGGDAFVAKFTSSDSLLWGTYYGGGGEEAGGGITMDTNNNIYVTGLTNSGSSIATSGAYQTNYGGGGCDAFLAKFTESGSLVWGTYYGGSGSDLGQGITIDGNNNIYVTGFTSSLSGIATSGAHQTSGYTNFSGDGLAFVAKFSSSGSLAWGTYYGKDPALGSFAGNGITSDPNNNVYITGHCYSSSGIVTSGAYQTNYGGGGDAFVAKFSSSGSLSWGTLFGGSSGDDGLGITTDGNSNVYITGFTGSNGIATSGAYQTSYGGGGSGYEGGDAFVAKFTTSGSLSWATYYGGSGNDLGNGITADANSNVYITGSTTSTGGIATPGAYQLNYGGAGDADEGDAFLAKFSSSGSLSYGTYYGGSEDDGGQGICTDAYNNIYLTGMTTSSNGIATSGAYQTTIAAQNRDVFVVKFSFCNLNTKINKGSLSVCSGSSASYIAREDSGFNYIWSVIGGTISSGQNSDTVNIIWGSAGTGYIKVLETNDTCGGSAIDTVIINPLPVANAGINATICSGSPAYIGSAAISGYTYSWASNPRGFTSTNATASPAPTINTTYHLTETITATGCSNSDSVVITVDSLPPASTGGNAAICITHSAIIGSKPEAGNTYSWSSLPPGFTSDSANVLVSPTQTTTYIYTEKDSATACSKTDSVIVYLSPPAITGGNMKYCAGNVLQLGAKPIRDDIYKWVSIPSGFNDTLANPIVSPTATTTYILTETVREGGCSKTDSAIISVYPKPLAKTGNNQTICFGKSVSIGDTPVNGNTYSWISNPVGFASTAAEASAAPSVTTTYYLTETDTATGCSKTDSVIITVLPPLHPQISATPSQGCLPLTVNFSSATNATTYHWNFGDNDSGSGQNISHTYYGKGDTSYKATLSVSNGYCTDTASTVIKITTFNPAKDTIAMRLATVQNNRQILVLWNKHPLAAKYEVQKSLDNVHFKTIAYIQDSFYVDDSVKTDSTSYYYKITGIDNCDSASAPSPTARTIYLQGVVENNDAECVTQWNAYQGFKRGVDYYNLFRNGRFIATGPTLLSDTDFSFFTTDTVAECYYARAYGFDGLISQSNEICLPVNQYIWIPNAFTPNGDGLNDTFKIVVSGLVSYQFYIYNRWGERMFETSDASQGWDGYFMGKPAEWGTYIYILEYQTQGRQWQQKSGNITLIR